MDAAVITVIHYGSWNGSLVRILPVHARRNERRFILDLPFVDHATKVPEETILTDAAGRTKVRCEVEITCLGLQSLLLRATAFWQINS